MSTRRSVAPEIAPADASPFAADVARSLSLEPRQLPSRYLYDELGSALFEAICRLPWYGLARAERRLLAQQAPRILESVAPLARVVELGPGSGEKLATLVDAAVVDRHVTVHLVDLSTAALSAAEGALAARRNLSIVSHRATYQEGLDEIGRSDPVAGRTLVLVLGSNIGNFDPPAARSLLCRVRGALAAGDFLLIGTDLVRSVADLLRAYDDPLGVTAAFNLNLLLRANRELGADFDVASFAHRAVWNAEHERVEMHLVSRRRQRVRVPAARLDLTFDEGETIWTESSHKYRPEGVVEMLRATGFREVAQWTRDHFGLTLAQTSGAV